MATDATRHPVGAGLRVMLILLACLATVATSTSSPDMPDLPQVSAVDHHLLRQMLGDAITPTAFLQHYYRQDLLHIPAIATKKSADLWASDSWFEDLKHVDALLAETLVQFHDDDNVFVLRNNKARSQTINTTDWSVQGPRFYAEGQSAVIRREFQDVPQSPFEHMLLDVFGASEVTAHAYISAPHALALPPHTDQYDVVVVQVFGHKEWTICTGTNDSSADWPEATPAQLAQIYELEISNPEGCRNWAIKDLERMHCRQLTLRENDILYLPKALIHFATTNDNITSAHVTYSIDRDEASWRDVIETACWQSQHPLCAVVSQVLAGLDHSALGLPWIQLAHEPMGGLETSCATANDLVRSYHPYSLRSLMKAQTFSALPAYVTPHDMNMFLARLADCNATMGVDEKGHPVSMTQLIINRKALDLLHPTPSRNRRDVAWTAPCNSKGGVCTGCNGRSCDDSCNSGETCDNYGCDSSCNSGDDSCDNSCDGTCNTCTGGCDTYACNTAACAAGYYKFTNDITNQGCQVCQTGKYQEATHNSWSCKNCAAGTYASTTGRTSCTACPGGQFQTATGQSSCKSCSSYGTVCDSGQYQGGCTGSTPGSCYTCSSGTYQNANSHRAASCKTCAACGIGKYYGCTITAGTTCSVC
ncbi:uncharacterized protein MONBRDRAFT_28039 [Monosiga brevicollis MX1]|uniref:Bifunctional lysine-specific demethylase and histidyl-hydroxylase n=1 Tax=Monosiga brevicollis TaxID=81824 RepID=A9V710_MONBE|nr:uncharacterized protein MONBRDRAFT_28039 [Monosiga brevicollis MX1]EDQ86709.1 predicted protein [Monosiga brevicollis MX1]|eukprot:XP_001748545.1 hypothetical protein [Monosiga brevicollis MX1]